MNIFIFTTHLNDWNSIIINDLLKDKGIIINGIYTAKSLGGDKGIIHKAKRILNYGILNLATMLFQRIIRKKNTDYVKICSDNLFVRKIPIYAGKKMSTFIDLAIEQKNDLILLLYFNRIIPKRYIREDVTIINVHPGKLPLYRGAQPVFWAMFNGEKEFGISIHKVEEGIDTGDLFFEDIFESKSNSLYQNMILISHNIGTNLTDRLKKIRNNEIIPRKQKMSNIYYSRPNSKQVSEFLNNGNKYY